MKCINADVLKTERLIVSGTEILPGNFETQKLIDRLNSLEAQLNEVRQLAVWAADAVEKSDSLRLHD